MILLRYANIVVFVVFAVFCGTCQAWKSWWWPKIPKVGECPSPHLLHPCICLKSRLVLTCEDLDNEDRLKAITKVSKNSRIIGVEFESVAMRFIPKDAFEGMYFKFLAIKNSEIMALSDTDQAFIGLENSLESFTVTNCPYVSKWEWYHLSNLTKLDELAITDSELFEIDDDFLKISHLPITSLRFIDTSLHRISKTAFSGFKYLNKMFLDKNELTEISRELFPRPAKSLTSLGLAYNNIQALPEDMFQDMPALKFLHIGANPLYILDQKIFKPVWKKLATFIAHDMNLICDCRLTWITKYNYETRFVLATCTTPRRLEGRKISELESDDLWCATSAAGGNGIKVVNDVKHKL